MTTLKHDNIKYEIASPCDQSWADMSGDDKCRFCSLCEKNVYNLSSMTDEEVTKLITGDETVCTRVFQRPDGTILTEDCPVGLKQVRKHLIQRQFFAATLCLFTILLTNFSNAGEFGKRKMGKMMARPYIQEVTEASEIERVGPEENWDYEKKEEIEERAELMIMGEMIAPIED